MEDENNNIEIVVENDGKNLEISPVFEHLKVAKPKTKKINKDTIIIPEVKNKK